jgi:membrane-bound ClpP family serine protease
MMCRMADPTLQEALNFTDEDLVANRAGKLGPTQQGRMTTTKGRSQVTNLIFGAVFLVIIVVIGFSVLPQYLSSSAAGQYVPIVVGVLILVVLIIGFTILRSRRKLNRLDGAVLVTQGAADTRAGVAPVSGGAMLPVYRLSIGSVTFALSSPEPMRAFVSGQQYKAYYVQGTLPILVSAEPV